MSRDLRSFIELLRKQDELTVIETPVTADLELAEIHRRVISEGGKALLFTKVDDSPFPVVTNLFGTKKRVELAFGESGKNFIREVSRFPETLLPPSLNKLWSNRSTLAKGLKVGLKKVPNAPVKANRLSPPQLNKLPVLKTWELDGGAFFTLPLVYTEDPLTKIPNLGMYRMQRHSDNATGMHMQIGKGGGFHLAAAKKLNESLPINVFLGGPPSAILAAIAPLPENVPELLLASLMLGERLRLSSLPDSPLPALADAEFVLTGEVSADDILPEGPFGDHYGYYSLKHDYPVFRVRSLYHREGAIYPATVVGKPRQEDFFIGDYLQELLSPLFPLVMPGVRDLWSYGETGYHSLAAAVVKDRYKREALVSGFRILGEGQLSLTKFLLLTDRPICLQNFSEVLTYILERADFRTDLYLFSNLSMDTLDYSGPEVNKGSKGILLGVGEPIRELTAEFKGELPRGIDTAVPFCPGCLVVSGTSFSDEVQLPERIAAHPAFQDFPLIILCDDATKTAASTPYFLWSVFTRFEPAADIYAKKTTLHRFHPSLEVPVVIDSRMKPSYPEELECDERTRKLVDSKWVSYF
jgi:4-hydroxybenzoate decarboxylase subunit C